MYGVPYMAAVEERFELTIRGFSPRELCARAEGECAKHFGERGWQICEQRCRPCLVSLGGRVKLYEATVVAEFHE
jgi:hypothetical protein